jgi:hypothetical protein
MNGTARQPSSRLQGLQSSRNSALLAGEESNWQRFVLAGFSRRLLLRGDLSRLLWLLLLLLGICFKLLYVLLYVGKALDAWFKSSFPFSSFWESALRVMMMRLCKTAKANNYTHVNANIHV